ncbi:DEKNAAC103620 [Brettanomyces naardenensis]|uniref:DEKNAAC103620 n=1 Tax=Brettanomyces naardenensis TaxID=13370 RepID=A0A448YNZ6_BRENA|nr:DEKNAAC103620 [Brettanomyces naardenensis]
MRSSSFTVDIAIGSQRRLRSRTSSEPPGPSPNDNSPSGNHVAFEEPPLAQPTNGATGQPLEEPPNTVSKRELGASLKKKSSANQEAETELIAERLKRERETEYIGDLNTSSSEPITQPSELRTNANMKEEPIYDDEDYEYPSRKKQKKVILKLSPVKTSRKNGNVNFAQANSIPIETDDVEEEEEEAREDENNDSNEAAVNNQDFCSSCGLPGSFICCEGCPKSFHFHCLNPPLDPLHLPDQWFCNECLRKQFEERHGKEKHPRNVGIFGRMLDDLEFTNPAAFRLPRDICEAFEGVAMDKFGDFMDDSLKPVKTYRQIVKEMEDPLHGVYDTEGNPYFCYKCGESGLGYKELIKCDYCSQCWHLDCLDPPLASVKQLGAKWKCPNHADNVIQPALRLRDQPSVEISATRGINIPADADVEIINVDDAAVRDEAAGTRYIYDDSEARKEMETNPLYQYSNKADGLKYVLSDAMTQYAEHTKLGNVTYRLKEEGIILDFIKGAKIRKTNQKGELVRQNLTTYAKLRPELREYLWSLSQLSKRDLVTERQKKINFNELLELADGEYKLENEKLNKHELRELLVVKKLMEIKGSEKMISFLRS